MSPYFRSFIDETRYLEGLRQLKLFSNILWVLLLVASCLPSLTNAQDIPPEKSFTNYSDRELIEGLVKQPKDRRWNTSDAHRYEIHGIANEIFTRGEKMIPLLAGIKGNKEFNWDFGLGRLNSVQAVIKPTDIPEKNDGGFLTNEVAALYLISAIYRGRLDFASNPYLDDGTCRKSWWGYNTPNRIEKAWKATEKWMKKLSDRGLDPLKREKMGPLSNSGIHWNGDGGKPHGSICKGALRALLRHRSV